MSTLFEPGARPDGGFIPLCVPEIRGNEWAYVKECLDTGWVSSVGSFVDRFEREMAAYVGTRYGVATVNGTAALHIALLVAGVRSDDEVIIPALTFIAPANAVRYAGAWPVFIDVEPDYWQLDPEQIAEFIERECRWAGGELRNRLTGRRVSAILPVHILGHPVDMDPILALARSYGLRVIEDATESLGATYRGGCVGRLGELACFSFNGNKIITTGGGGMIVTDRLDWMEKAKYLTTQAKDDPVEYVHKEIGYNYRLTNIQAAMGCAQLELLEAYIEAKRRIAMAYTSAFQEVSGITPMRAAPDASPTYWMYTVLVDPTRFGMDSRALLRRLARAGIQARPLWQPIHLSPSHASSVRRACPVSEQLYLSALSLPCSAGLTVEEQERVIEEIRLAARSG